MNRTMAKKKTKEVVVRNATFLKKLNAALGTGVPGMQKLKSVTLVPPIDCPPGWEPVPIITPTGVDWTCKKKP